MKRIFRIFLALGLALLAFSCETNPVLVIDDFNVPGMISIIPGNETLTVAFSCENPASDFLGYNIYIMTTPAFSETNFLRNASGVRPSMPQNAHSFRDLSYTITHDVTGAALVNGAPYYIVVTAYGTNAVLEFPVMETKNRNIHVGIPRYENTITLTNWKNATALGVALTRSGDTLIANTAGLSTNDASIVFYFLVAEHPFNSAVLNYYAATGNASVYCMQPLGYEKTFSNRIVFPTDGYQSAGTRFLLQQNSLYGILDGAEYIKIWIESGAELSTEPNVAADYSIRIRYAIQKIGNVL